MNPKNYTLGGGLKVCVFKLSMAAFLFTAEPAFADVEPGLVVTSIKWDDADSGKINGERFRLYSVDAPETGGVGSRGGAKCEGERKRGYKALGYMVGLTQDAELIVTATYGQDKMQKPRWLIDLSANGEDVSQTAIEDGHLLPWPHDGTRQLAPKPNWCSWKFWFK